MTSSSIVWAARGQSAWKSTSLRHQFHAPTLNSCGLFPFHLAEAQLDPSTCFGRHGSATDKKDTFPPYTSQTNTSYRNQLSGRRPLPKHVTHADANTPQPFPGSRHKKTWFLPCNVVLLWIRSVLMPLLLFLTAVSWRWTWPMPFRGLIQFSNMSQSWFFRQKLTQASVKFTNLQSRTQTQNEICKINPSKIFPCKCKVSKKNKISKSSRNITNGLKLCQGRTVSHAFKPVSVATPRRNLHTHI